MAVRVIGAEYTDLKGRVLDFPVGNTGNTITAKYTIDCSFKVELSNSIQIFKLGNQLTLIGANPNGGALTWEAFGITAGLFYVGLYPDGGTPITGTATVDFTDGANMYTTTDISGSQNNITIFVGNITQLKTPEGFDILFNVTPNNAKTSTSPIDGEVQRFQVDNVNLMSVGSTLPLVQLGNKSGGSLIDMNLKMLLDGTGQPSKFELTVKYRYPNYLDAELFEQALSVCPYIRIGALAQFANPNTTLFKTYSPDGNIGWFDEHFNGGLSPYTPVSIAWTNNSGASIPDMDYAQISRFTIDITGNFDTSCQFNFGWFWNPLIDTDYKNKPLSHDNNVLLATKINSNSVVGNSETILGFQNSFGAKLTITNLNYTVIGSGIGATLRITGRTSPNADFTEFFDTREGDRAYKIWIDCDESAFNTDWNSSTSTNVIVADSQMVKTPVPLGAWDDITYNKFLDHNDDEFLNPKTYTEDDLNLVVRFRLPRNFAFQSITCSMVVYNSATGGEFTLESKVFTIAPSFTLPFLADGSMPINFVENRGYKQPNGTGKNELRLQRYTSIDNTNNYGLELNYGFLCRWEYWLDQLNADPAFFTSDNKNWQHYQSLGWQLKAKMEITRDIGTYTNSFPLAISAYDDYNGVSTLRFYKLDNTLITAPLTNEPCRVEFTHVINSPYDWDTPYWANHRVEQLEGAPSWMLSSRAFTLDPANPLYPIAGETGVRIVVTGDTVVTDCLFDPIKLSGAFGLSFNGRIQGNETPEAPSAFVYQTLDRLLTQDGDILTYQ